MPQANNNSIIIPLPRALPQAARKKVEAAIDCHLSAVQALTAFLDEADSDPDLEPYLAGFGGGDDREGDPADPPEREGIDENKLDVSYNEGHGRGGVASTQHDDQEGSIGWPERVNQANIAQSFGSSSFGGGQWGGCVSDEAEPSLGSLDGQINQSLWSHGTRCDQEAEHDGREPECEDEGAEHDGREPAAPPFELDQTQEGRP